MLDFFANYPIGHYLRAMGRPGNAAKIGMYISRDSTMMLVRRKDERIYWNGTLRELGGAPGLEITLDSKERGPEATPYRREVYKKLSLNKGNQVHVILDDPETYTSHYSVTNYETAEDLADALAREPSSIITSWKNYTTNDDYVWEIMAADMSILRGPSRLPKKVLLCGFPTARAVAAARWAEKEGQELANLVPTVAAVLKWCAKEGPQEGFFMLISTNNEIGTAFFERGELKIFTGQKTKEGFTTDDITDLVDLAEETGAGRDTTIWCWGILPGSTPHARLASRYKNLRTVTCEELRGVYPIELKDRESRMQDPEAWLLDAMLGDE